MRQHSLCGCAAARGDGSFAAVLRTSALTRHQRHARRGCEATCALYSGTHQGPVDLAGMTEGTFGAGTIRSTRDEMAR